MSDEIINRVANSSLEVVDLEELYVEGIRNLISISRLIKYTKRKERFENNIRKILTILGMIIFL